MSCQKTPATITSLSTGFSLAPFPFPSSYLQSLCWADCIRSAQGAQDCGCLTAMEQAIGSSVVDLQRRYPGRHGQISALYRLLACVSGQQTAVGPGAEMGSPVCIC